MTAQDGIVALVAALALSWLVLRWWRARRRSSGTACAHCPVATTVPGVRPAPQAELLLSIGEPTPAPQSPQSRHAPPANPPGH